MRWRGLARAAGVVAVLSGAFFATALVVGLRSPHVAEGALDRRSGGMTTTFDDTSQAFQHSARNIGLDDRRLFADGDVVFERVHTEAEGLGPRFDAPGCASCHVNNGRAVIGDDGPLPPGVVVQLAGAGDLGVQLQRRATEGAEPEGAVTVRWERRTGHYPDGTPYELRRPTVTVSPPLPPGATWGLRVAPPVIGTGLLEAIRVEDLLAWADPGDSDGDGISGRLHELPGGAVGRFGWRASQPSVVDQTEHAFAEDLGLAGPDAPDGGTVRAAAFYSQALAVTGARDTQEVAVRRGAALFGELGCSSCHVDRVVTGESPTNGLGGQTIHPYTDLLLHDMGPGLEGGPVVDGVGAREWRTPPLWGVGLAEVVAGGPVGYLHDGRARTLEEAILWHDGEAAAARIAFEELPAERRSWLLAFLAAL